LHPGEPGFRIRRMEPPMNADERRWVAEGQTRAVASRRERPGPRHPGGHVDARPSHRRSSAFIGGSFSGSESSKTQANKWVVLALSAAATFMTTLDSSIVNIGLPSIAHTFGVPLAGSIEWVLIGYLVTIAATLLTFGRLADTLGHKPLFLAGLAVFTLGSALCGAAPSLGALIAARCFQGLGAAAILCVNVAMITRSFPGAERGRALGLNMILLALGVSAGPTIGGILTQALSWRWIFYVNLPLGSLALLASWCLLPDR